MPTYEYECPDCKHRFEQYQSITAAPVKVCPACSRRRVKRLISAGGGFIFKGSGFYATDYRSPTYTKQAKAEQAASAPAAKTETKPAAKEPAQKTAERAR